jgi:hypothetical protein
MRNGEGMSSVVTVVSGLVPIEGHADVVRQYEAAVSEGPPPSIEMTFLLEDEEEMAVFTVWRSREDLTQMRAVGQEPFALRLLRTAGASPSVRVFNVTARIGS